MQKLFPLTIIVIQVLSSSLRVDAAALHHHDFRTCSFASTIRIPDENSIDTAYKDEIYEIFEECPHVYAPLSQVSNCISSFDLDTNNAIQHLQSTIDVLNDHYVFKDIAIDPLQSNPITTPFDYPIYNGTEQGQFDIISGLEELVQEIKSKNRASLDMFLQMNALAARLFDAHFNMNSDISTGGMLSNQTIVFFSGEVLDGNAKSTSLRTVFPTDDDFVLVADITTTHIGSSSASEVVVTSKQIQKIDGKDPLDFFIEIASKPLGVGVYKSLGPRVEAMIRYLTATPSWVSSEDYPGYFARMKLIEKHPDISKFLKDEYDVLYQDGSNTTWKLLQLVPLPVSCDLIKADIESLLLAQPGKMYGRLESMKRAVIRSERIIQLQQQTQRIKQREKEDPDLLLLEATERTFQHSFDGGEKEDVFNFTMISSSKAVGYKVFNDYAVLKINSFSTGGIDNSVLLEAWVELTNEAHRKNVKKLIIDIIGNKGGVVKYGYFLAQLLCPTATWEDLSNPYDRLYAPSLQDHVWDVKKILDTYDLLLKHNFTKLEQMTDTLNADSVLLIQKFDAILNLLEATMDILSGDQFLSVSNLRGSVLSAIESTKRIREAVQLEEKKGHAIEKQQLHTLWHTFVTVAHDILNFPFHDLNFKQHFGIDVAYTSVTKRAEYLRGGIFGNYTGVFHLLNPNVVASNRQYQEDHIRHPSQFDQYMVLGSGNNCGSTSDTFRHTIQSYAYDNKDKGDVPSVRTVSFGGSGKHRDAAVTQFPAGVAGTAGNVEELYLIALILRVFHTLLPPDATSLAVFDTFYNALPDACYYCSKPFTMPIFQIYSKLTGSESIPLEYVNQLPDYYLRQWPSKTSFVENQDLPILYALVRPFFLEEEEEITVE